MSFLQRMDEKKIFEKLKRTELKKNKIKVIHY